MRIEARGKINWCLDILGRREDGYHLMDMLMQPVSLSDTIEMEKQESFTLKIPSSPWLSPGEDNLMMKAARAMEQAAGRPLGAAMTLHKRLPSGAGMGGGSADAAAVIAGLNRLWQLGFDQPMLEKIGLTVGADVPFCLRGGLCRVGGIGEEMTSLPCAKNYWLVIVQPCRGLSTREVFAAYAQDASAPRPQTDQAQAALQRGHIPLLKSSLANVLEPVSREMRPAIGQAIAELKALGAFAALMTGSGSAVFGTFYSASQARQALKRLGHYPVRHMVYTCQESLIFDHE